MDRPHFSPALFSFFRDLARNNNRDFFTANRRRYEDEVRDPALAFIADFGPRLATISPHFLAIPKPTGGSLFRLHRDTRFSPDKRPFKTHTGLHFRHRQGGDVHAPGFYLHLDPAGCFAGAGIWRPDAPTLRRIRDAIVGDPSGWTAARDGATQVPALRLGGEALRRPPRGYPADHPLLEDLKRTDFVVAAELDEAAATAPDLLERFTELCRAASPLVSFLCRSLGVPF